MYTDWFKLDRLPFRLRPDPDFLFAAEHIAPVLAALRSAAENGRGLLVLLGEPGTGKTTLLHTLALERAGSMTVVRIQQSSLTPREMMESIEAQCGLPADAANTRDLRARFSDFVAEEARQGRNVLLLVDEAHQLPVSALRELQAVAMQDPAPLVVLAGEPALLTQLDTLATRRTPLQIIATLRLPRLGLRGIGAYVTHRLKVAGARNPDLFDREALVELERYTGGTPQLIHVLSDAALGVAKGRSSARVGAQEVRDAASELKWVEFAARAHDATQVGQLPAELAATGLHASPTPPPAADGTDSVLQAPAEAALPVIAELDVRQGGRPLTRLMLRPGRLVIGRAEDAGLRLESRFVSRQHCQVITTAAQSFVEDLGSTNGLQVNGRLRRLHRLVPGDRISLGDYELTYLETPAPEGY